MWLIINMGSMSSFRSSSYQDELGWAGVWLYQATGNSKYLTEAETNRVSGAAWGDSWDDKTASTNVRILKLDIALWFGHPIKLF